MASLQGLPIDPHRLQHLSALDPAAWWGCLAWSATHPHVCEKLPRLNNNDPHKLPQAYSIRFLSIQEIQQSARKQLSKSFGGGTDQTAPTRSSQVHRVSTAGSSLGFQVWAMTAGPLDEMFHRKNCREEKWKAWIVGWTCNGWKLIEAHDMFGAQGYFFLGNFWRIPSMDERPSCGYHLTKPTVMWDHFGTTCLQPMKLLKVGKVLKTIENVLVCHET